MPPTDPTVLRLVRQAAMRRRVLLRDGREGTLVYVKRNARKAKVLCGGAHLVVPIEEIEHVFNNNN